TEAYIEIEPANPANRNVSFYLLMEDTCERIVDLDPVLTLAGSPTSTETAELPEVPTLEGNYPNPFNPRTTIRFALPAATPVTLTVYDALGRQLDVLVHGTLLAGQHEVAFDASALPSGVYLYRLDAGA